MEWCWGILCASLILQRQYAPGIRRRDRVVDLKTLEGNIIYSCDLPFFSKVNA